MTTDDRPAILDALRAWIAQRAGLDLADYCDHVRPGADRSRIDRDGLRAYRAEARRIAQQGADARELLRMVEARPGVTGAMLAKGFDAFSGRLSWDGARLSYITGQYFPTEYRLAAATVLRAALWDYWREDILSLPADPAMSVKDRVKRNARLSVSPGVFRRWFKEA